MLSAPDAAVVARDPALPGLALVLDAGAFAERLSRRLPDQGIIGAESTYLRYKPGTSCVAAFRLERVGGDPIEVYAKAHTIHHYGTVVRRRETLRAPTALNRARHLFDDLAIVVRSPIGDREMKALRRLFDPERYPRQIRQLLRATPTLWDAQLDTLRYKPERRFVGRLLYKGQPAAVLKVYCQRDFKTAFAGAAFAAAIGHTRLLGALATHRILAVSWLPGTPLQLHTGDTLAPKTLRRVGAKIAELHGGIINHSVPRTREFEAEATIDAAESLAFVCSHLSARIREIAWRAVEDLRSAPFRPCSIHGDFSADQIIINGERVEIIDWDNAACGDPAADLGSFIARLEADATNGTMPASATERAVEELRSGYEEVTGTLPAAIDLQTVIGLIRLASENFRNRIPNWPERTEALLDRSEEIYRRTGLPMRQARLLPNGTD